MWYNNNGNFFRNTHIGEVLERDKEQSEFIIIRGGNILGFRNMYDETSNKC